MVYNHGQRLSPSFIRHILPVILFLAVPPFPVIVTLATFTGHRSHMRSMSVPDSWACLITVRHWEWHTPSPPKKNMMGENQRHKQAILPGYFLLRLKSNMNISIYNRKRKVGNIAVPKIIITFAMSYWSDYSKIRQASIPKWMSAFLNSTEGR